MNVFVLQNTKEDILKNVGNRAVLGHHWLPHYLFSYYGSQWCPKTAWLQTFFKISSFVFCWTKKLIQVWSYLRVSKWWQIFRFWVNYPFKKEKLFYLVDPENTVLFVAREREKAYKPEQEDPEVVQPFAAYSPAGNVKVSFTTLIYFTVHACVYIILQRNIVFTWNSIKT